MRDSHSDGLDPAENGEGGTTPEAGTAGSMPPNAPIDAAADSPGDERLRSEVLDLKLRNAELEEKLSTHGRVFSVAPGSTGRRIISTLLAIVAAILVPISVLTVWTSQTVTNTDQYVATVAPLAQDPAIQAAVTNRITDEVYKAVDVPKLVNDVLPPRASQLSGPLSSAVKGFIHTTTSRVVASSVFQRIWTTANRVAHAQVVAALEGTSTAGVQVKNGSVELNLATLVNTVKQRLVSQGLTVANKIPTDRITSTITLFSSPQLHTFQRVFNLLRILGLWLPIGVFLVLVAGVLTARSRRRALIGVGIYVAIGMLLLEIGLSIVRALYLSHLPASVQSPDAAAAAFDILVRILRQSGWGLFTFAVLLALGAYLAGPSRAVRALRSSVTRLLGRGGTQLEAHGVLPRGLRTFFGHTLTAWEIGVTAAAVAALVLWRERTVSGVLWTLVLLLAVLAVLELLGRHLTPAVAVASPAGIGETSPPPTPTSDIATTPRTPPPVGPPPHDAEHPGQKAG